MVTPEYRFITTPTPEAGCIALIPHPVAPGVYECCWRGPSATDPSPSGDAVLVEIDNAPPGWFRLADILIAPTHTGPATAMTAADALATRYTGSAVIAVPLEDGSVAIRSSEEVVIIRDGQDHVREAAIRRYCQLLFPALDDH